MDEEIREEHELIENMQKDLDETYLDVLLKRFEENLKDLLKRLEHPESPGKPGI